MKRLTDKRMKGEGFIPVDPKEYKAFIRNEKPTGKQIYQHLLEVEDILGDDYDLDRLRELVEADREGRCVVLPCHIGDPVFMGTGRSKITGYEEDICDGFYIGRNGVLQVEVQNNKGNHGTYGVIGQTVELTHEAAEAALKGDQHGQDL